MFSVANELQPPTWLPTVAMVTRGGDNSSTNICNDNVLSSLVIRQQGEVVVAFRSRSGGNSSSRVHRSNTRHSGGGVIPTPMAARRLTDSPTIGSRRRLTEEEKKNWWQQQMSVDRSFHRLENERNFGDGG
ncbi:unnamed protein product [Lactuca saligna]|uniref:Uncharacterized protein n=1 Tax=Lactuca saligna TaxID=75948 RepID=A0AA35YWM1_LACSI|nr:unnamed protein product [Lactuca saligna]